MTKIDEQMDEKIVKMANHTRKSYDIVNGKFETNTMRHNLNSLSLRNYPFTEKTKVFAENGTDFVKYDYMHIRMKP